MDTTDLISIADSAVKQAQKFGADHCEAFIAYGSQLSVNLEDSSIVKANNKSLTGIGLRVIVGQSVGLASATQFDSKIITATVKDAVNLAKASNPDPAVVGLAEQAKGYPIVEGLFDKKLASLESGKLVEFAITALDASLAKEASSSVGGNIGLTITNNVIVNSNGVNVNSNKTALQGFISNKITKEDDIGVGYEFGFGRNLSELDFEHVGSSSAEKALKMLGAQKIDSGDYKFILDERATRNTIQGIISKGISAYQIDQGTAFFNDRLGEEIASEALTIYDNPLEKGGLGSRSYDHEGTPCQKLTLVEKGTLLTYLSDVYTSHKLDIPNTGSASKNGYAGIPHPNLSLIQIEPGTATKDELLAEVGTGLYLESQLFAMSGTNISQQVDVGFWVEKGEIQFPVKNTMLGTTVYDVLKNIELVGKEILTEAGMKSPHILVGPTKFSGGR